MRGYIKIAADPEAAAAGKDRLGEDHCAAMRVECRLMEASRKDVLSIMRCLGSSLKLTPLDWLMLISMELGIGPLQEKTETFQVSTPEELRRKLEELRSRGGGE